MLIKNSMGLHARMGRRNAPGTSSSCPESCVNTCSIRWQVVNECSIQSKAVWLHGVLEVHVQVLRPGIIVDCLRPPFFPQ